MTTCYILKQDNEKKTSGCAHKIKRRKHFIQALRYNREDKQRAIIGTQAELATASHIHAILKIMIHATFRYGDLSTAGS